MAFVGQMFLFFAIVLSCVLLGVAEETYWVHSFERLQLTDQFYCEGASYADFNHDGKVDVVSGPYWYAGGKFAARHEYRAVKNFDVNGYSDNFLTFAYDIDADGWADILAVGFPGQAAFWYQNPKGAGGQWTRHTVHSVVDNESPTVTDLTGDGQPELVFNTGGQLGYAAPDPTDPTKPWEFHAISPKGDYQRFTHGIGVGDINGDGRPDLLEKGAWWENPGDRSTGDRSTGEFWTRHPMQFSAAGGAQMFAYDFDGDGDNDVVTSKAAHAYGLSWFENIRDGDRITFREHSIMGETPKQNDYGVVFSQLHAVALADVDLDGIMDIVTGKRYWAHNGHDPGARDPAVSYWFKTVRDGGSVRFVPYRIDLNSGVGTQVTVGDVNGDKWPDLVVGNKKGTFVLVHHAKEVDRSSWQLAQPRRRADKQSPPKNDSAGILPVGENGEPLNLDFETGTLKDWVLDGKAFVDQPIRDEAAKSSLLHAGLDAAAATEAMELPLDFSVQVFAAEPDVKQPIAMALDDRGRIWVAEAYEYPRRAPDGEGRDRILIFEDTDQDGQFDRRTVFAEGLNLVSGLEVGFGGVWVGASPYLLFIPDRDGDDVPDGQPEVLLDGWHYEDTHETLNAFIWGPDGWLYGCHGVFTHSVVGKPGTPKEDRTRMNAGVWRYHPTRHQFEVFAHGTSNPWGVDFNDRGQMFISACVIPHLYHMVQGGRYQRQGGTHFNRYTYDDIKTIADHSHYAGNISDHAWWRRDTPAVHASTDAAGGGHAHAGAMIYLGGSWPETYRNSIFMNNIHGARLNRDLLTPKGSGYVGSHGADFLLARDQASQIINMRYGPDGQVYMIDWYDMQQCHRHDPSAHDRANGRVFRIAYRNTRPVAVNLKDCSDAELVELQLDDNEWYVRHARRVLQERAGSAPIDAVAMDRLVEIAAAHEDETRRLRALWVLHVTNRLSAKIVDGALADESPFVRAWTLQLALENQARSAPEFISRMAELAKYDASPVVRLYLASAAQRIPFGDRFELLANLASHAEDATDHNLPLMVWYALEPLVEHDSARALTVAEEAKIPGLLANTVRRVVDIGTEESIVLIVKRLAKTSSAEQQLTFLESMAVSLEGRRRHPMPAAWTTLYGQLAKSKSVAIRHQARRLAVKFGDARALAETRAILANSEFDLAERKSALHSLLSAQDSHLAPTLRNLIAEKDLRREALRGLAAYADETTPRFVLDRYDSFDGNEKRDVLNTLASRPSFAKELLDAIVAKRISPGDLSADLIRQLRNLGNKEILATVSNIWGVVRDTPEDKKRQIEQFRQIIQNQGRAPDIHLGRAIFAKTCQQCHKLFGVGESIGPELTGSNRSNLEYLLDNVVDPSAVMAKEYQPTVVVTDSGRTITGIIVKQNDRAVTITTANETLVVPQDEIEEMVLSPVSMMPDDQWLQMKPHEMRSLVAYLSSPKQVPLQATSENASMFFNGKDLTGWVGDLRYWSVEDGEIVGSSPGLKENHFLVSELVVSDFELDVDVKLTPNAGNSGIQFRSELEPGGSVKGYQADIGKGWWGKLYEEHGRTILWNNTAQQHVKENAWNTYRIVAVGHRIRTYLNGNLCVDLDDPNGALHGIVALQIHAGEPMEIRFKNMKLTPRRSP